MTMTVHADNMTLNLRGAVTQKHKARSVFVSDQALKILIGFIQPFRYTQKRICLKGKRKIYLVESRTACGKFGT